MVCDWLRERDGHAIAMAKSRFSIGVSDMAIDMCALLPPRKGVYRHAPFWYY